VSGIHSETLGNGKPLVLVHGWAMHSEIWRTFAEELAKHYRVILVDLPGHGRSAPSYPFTLENIGGLLVKAVDEPSACWLGWSMGAEIVIDIARRHPGRVNRLLLLAGSPCFVKIGTWPGVSPDILDSFAINLQADTRGTLLNFLSLQTRGLDDQKAQLRILKQAVFEYPAADSQTLIEGLKLLKQTDLRQTFSGLSQPTAVILGELDTLIPVAVGASMAALLPQAVVTVLSRAGHAPFLSHQAAVVEAITQRYPPA
jgi:pimeloyl-[acyl-carrier protein] methyl ester esterase